MEMLFAVTSRIATNGTEVGGVYDVHYVHFGGCGRSEG